jgi:hypothetical protein
MSARIARYLFLRLPNDAAAIDSFPLFETAAGELALARVERMD